MEIVVEDACDMMLAVAVWQAGPLAMSTAVDCAQLRRTCQVSSATYQLVLLPVRVGLVQWEDRRRLALMNGETGKVALSGLLRSS